jgi:hypothetical protein
VSRRDRRSLWCRAVEQVAEVTRPDELAMDPQHQPVDEAMFEQEPPPRHAAWHGAGAAVSGRARRLGEEAFRPACHGPGQCLSIDATMQRRVTDLHSASRNPPPLR